MNNCSRVGEYKINKQKGVAFIHSNNEYAEKELRQTILFTIALYIHWKKPKYGCERTYSGNFKTSLEKKNTRKKQY